LEPSERVAIPSDSEVADRLAQRFTRVAGVVAIEAACGAAGARWAGAASPPADLRAARFERELDLAWRRTSYSALTAAAHDAGGAPGVDPSPAVGSEPERGGLDDEPASSEPLRVAAVAGDDPAA